MSAAGWTCAGGPSRSCWRLATTSAASVTSCRTTWSGWSGSGFPCSDSTRGPHPLCFAASQKQPGSMKTETVKETTPRPAAAHVAVEYRPPYIAAAVATVAVFALYAFTLSPTTAFWDTSEYIATAHIMGIPHPPGNPLFVVLARAWDLLLTPLGLPTAVNINLFSAAMGALAHGCWF